MRARELTLCARAARSGPGAARHSPRTLRPEGFDLTVRSRSAVLDTDIECGAPQPPASTQQQRPVLPRPSSRPLTR
eukprot:1341762-Rhodomonas_salina.1